VVKSNCDDPRRSAAVSHIRTTLNVASHQKAAQIYAAFVVTVSVRDAQYLFASIVANRSFAG
jgi:hypothetical protein